MEKVELPIKLVEAHEQVITAQADREAELVELEGAEEVDKEAVKAKRAEIRTAKADVRKAKSAITKFEVKARKEANRMPEQNGVRRPKPGTKCGQAWELADNLSAELGQPVPIAHLLEKARDEGLNEGNVKAEYVRWRKFNGVTGRVTMPKDEVEAPAEVAAEVPAQTEGEEVAE